MPDLDDQLNALRSHLTPPNGIADPRLEALIPCEPAIGVIAVACWVGADEQELIELVMLEDGTRVSDATALREALTLVAMVETMEELASFHAIGPLADELRSWAPPAELAPGLSPELVRAREAALAALVALHDLNPPEHARIARTQLLDVLGAALRELERAWELLEQAAELWSDSYLGVDPDAVGHASQPAVDAPAGHVEVVQGLWRILGIARSGPLAQPSSTALHAGREAGAALAAVVAETNQATATRG